MHDYVFAVSMLKGIVRKETTVTSGMQIRMTAMKRRDPPRI